MTGYHIINALMIEIIIIVNVVTGGKLIGSYKGSFRESNGEKSGGREQNTYYLHTVQAGNPQIRK